MHILSYKFALVAYTLSWQGEEEEPCVCDSENNIFIVLSA